MILIVPLILRIFAEKNINAMALWPFILVRNLETKESEVTIHHEKIHFRQQLEMLIIPFYFAYLISYIFFRVKGSSHFQAYLLIPFEKEAYANDSDFNYLGSRKWWAWRRYLNE
jgi:hypothetical protein